MWSNNNASNSSTLLNQSSGYIDTPERFTNANRGQNCVPVMIAHLNRFKDNLKFWGTPVRILTIVAIVEKIETVSTKVNFHFRDETGNIKGVKWLNAEIVNYVPPVKLNAYARIHGNMRNINNDHYVHVINIEPLNHVNDLLVHLMEVTLVCMESQMADQVATDSLLQVNMQRSTMNDEDDYPPDLNRDQSIIFNIIKHGDPQIGAERIQIKSSVPQYLVGKVDDILDFLSGEGHIYTTTTDDHFKII